MRDNDIIATVNEPFNAEVFRWEDRAFIRKKDADIIWGGRDVFIYEYNNALGKVLTVKDALEMENGVKEQTSKRMINKEDKDTKDIKGIKDKEKTSILIGGFVDSMWAASVIGNGIVEDAISGMKEKKSGLNIMGIMTAVIVLVIVIYVFLA